MKKNIFAITAAAALVLNIAATSVTTFAADNNSTSKTTTGHINLTTKSNDGKGEEMGITLDKVPTIEFGTHTISAKDQTYEATSVTDLQVTNPGYDSGWDVTMAAGPFKSTDDTSAAELRGAILKLGAGATTDPNGNSSAASVNAFDGNNSKAQSVFTAVDGTQGVGANIDSFTPDKATLFVPAGNVAGDYTSTLTWTLSSAATVAVGSDPAQASAQNGTPAE
ncbi:WxL domain-containing protein [Lacticaseibacillus songhuajiangensis]|uniref:WxL domain-containing protein n=1 Tax=Lacticaseibacillus songhuajiangensis TaxID=1296539 RepID=UPI000F7B0F6A|nr:WxL domain-containing protein [Lacticaseibacillus songhuajiangensis]